MYWPTWLNGFILRLITRLPRQWQVCFAQFLGTAAYYVLGQRRRISQTNLKLCFPDLSNSERTAICKKNFVAFGLAITETANSFWPNTRHSEPKLEIKGLEYMEKASAERKGVLVLGAHFTNIDMAGKLFTKHFDMQAIYRHQKNPIIDRLFTQSRERNFSEAYHRDDTRGIIRALKKGEAIWFAFDQDYGAKKSVFAPFFGIETATINASSKLANINNSAAVFLFSMRAKNNIDHIIEISPPLEDFPSGDDVYDATRINKALEATIRRYPEQYWWLHRRFKTRPEGEDTLY